MKKLTLTAAMSACITLGASAALAGESRNESRLDVAADGTVNIADSTGVVNIHSASGRQVLVVSVTRSAKIEVDQTVTPDKKRVEIVVHAVAGQRPSDDEARVDLDVAVPAGVSVTVSSATAPITVEGLSGNIISLSSDTGQIVVHNTSKAHVHVRSVTAPVTLNGILNGHVEIISAGGAVQLNRVSGPLVSVGTTNGDITYQGDCSGGGTYTLTTYSGAIDVTLPESASVDLSARSISGSVQNDFPLKEKTHVSFTPKPGSSFTGTSLSGSSSVELQSFSGRIRVKKQ
jgi:DUF4097 and DUF4098 domain-containing protein YvlB